MGRMSLLSLLLSTLLGQTADRPVSHDDLVSQYEYYTGKQLVISGEVLSGPEATLMFLRNSPSNSTDSEGMLVALSASAAANPGTLERRFVKTLKKTGRADMVARGRFEGAPDRIWGHMLCCRFRFQIDQAIGLK